MLEPHVTEGTIGLAEFVEVLIGGGQDKGPAHFLQQVGFDTNFVHVILDQNLVPAVQLVFIENVLIRKYFLRLPGNHSLKSNGRGFVIR